MNLNKLDKMNAECKLRHEAEQTEVQTSIPQVKSIFDVPKKKAGRPRLDRVRRADGLPLNKKPMPKVMDWEKIKKWADK